MDFVIGGMRRATHDGCREQAIPALRFATASRDRRPPSDGPSAVPIADIVLNRPMAFPVFAFGIVSPTIAIMMAPPKPCAARAAISSPSVGATPLRTEAIVNRCPHPCDRLRPKRTLPDPAEAKVSSLTRTILPKCCRKHLHRPRFYDADTEAMLAINSVRTILYYIVEKLSLRHDVSNRPCPRRAAGDASF